MNPLVYIATKTTLATLIKLMKQDATTPRVEFWQNLKQMAGIRLRRAWPLLLSWPEENLISGANIQHKIFQIFTVSISTVKHSFNLHCTASEGSFVYCTDQQHCI